MSFGFLNSRIFPVDSPSIANLRATTVRHHPEAPRPAKSPETPPKAHRLAQQPVLFEEPEEDISAMPPHPLSNLVPIQAPKVQDPSHWDRFKKRVVSMFKHPFSKRKRTLVIGAPTDVEHVGGSELCDDSLKAPDRPL